MGQKRASFLMVAEQLVRFRLTKLMIFIALLPLFVCELTMTRYYQRLSQGMDVVTSISMLDRLKYTYIVWESRIGYISVAHIYLYLTSIAIFRTMHA